LRAPLQAGRSNLVPTARSDKPVALEIATVPSLRSGTSQSSCAGAHPGP
jgi:hypothetical protein